MDTKKESEETTTTCDSGNKLREVARIDTSKIEFMETVNFADFKKLKIPTDIKGMGIRLCTSSHSRKSMLQSKIWTQGRTMHFGCS